MINKIINYLASIPHDKLLHFIAGIIISLIFSVITPYIALISAALFGIIKEIYDKISYGGFSWMDFLATSLGGLLIQIFILI